MFAEVIRAYEAQYKQPVSFPPGVRVEVLRGDFEFPNWFWCRVTSGKEGWVHSSFLADIASCTKSIRSYSGQELTVNAGKSGGVIEFRDGWVLLKLNSGEEGWLPQSYIRTSTSP